jgi:hypothetical protein
VEVWTRKGLRRFFVLFFIELSTRRVYVAGISARANGLWMNQIACNLTDAEDRLLQVKRYQIHTGSAVHRRISGDTDRSGRGVRPAAAPVAEPEQLRGTLRQKHQEIGSGTVDSVSEALLRTAVREFVAHYHTERNHQGLGDAPLERGALCITLHYRCPGGVEPRIAPQWPSTSQRWLSFACSLALGLHKLAALAQGVTTASSTAQLASYR